MSFRRFARLARSLEQLFPERHLYVRSGGEMKGYVLTPAKQMAAASAVAACAMWMGVSTAAMVVGAMTQNKGEAEIAQTQAKYERWIADRQARLNSDVAQLNSSSSSFDDLANTVEKRHAALAMLLTQMNGDPTAQAALAPAIAARPGSGKASPIQRIQMVRNNQERLIAAAESFAKNRADRLRLAFRLAGLDPAVYAGRGDALGGPLIESKDPRALAAVLDVDEGFASRIQHAASELSDTRGLADASRSLPFAHPADAVQQSSSYGVRLDPFTSRPAFHSGQDFSGAYMTPIHATAPGVVSFTGPRSGYGNAVEIDHGNGFKTRYAHLASIGVVVGQRVGVGQRIGGMGSTGRSTGTHLHYEVRENGHAIDPLYFVNAGVKLASYMN
jgi:murein DD-endopeptidase MepM/ murein hydrolase activator NlpD